MFGLVVLITIIVYLALSFWLAKKVSVLAKKKGKSGSFWYLATLVGMFLLIFWDYAPTILMHKYYCDSYAGLTINKSIDEWKRENSPINIDSYDKSKWITTDNITEIKLNRRFSWKIIKDYKTFNIIKNDHRITDEKTNDILAQYVDFHVDVVPHRMKYFRDFKSWLETKHCKSGKENKKIFFLYENDIEKLRD